ncbi:MAG: translocation/assembly module TamB, partial [Chakrabartia sp.]
MMRHSRRFVGALGLGLLLLAALLFAADTRLGHRFVVDRIESLEPRNGLRIGIDRIDGSLYGHMQVKGLKLSDQRGVFFEATHVDLDWTPLAWVVNRLDIQRLHAAKATLHRLPSLRPAPPGKPLLPNYDIRLDKLAIDRLTIRLGVSGRLQMGTVSARADIRDGRALIAALASTTQGDRLILNLDAAPDQDQFDVRLALDAPARGTLGAMLGTSLPLQLRLDGDGAWRAWRGMFLARLNGAEVARLALTNKAGLYGLSGQLEAAALPAGRARSLAVPRLILQGTARFTERRLKGMLMGSSSALSLKAEGGVTFASSSFEDLLTTSTLRDVRAIAPTMSGSALSLQLRLDGACRQAAFDYLLTAPLLKFGATGLEQMRASGQGRLSQLPIRIPVQFSARRITGVG